MIRTMGARLAAIVVAGTLWGAAGLGDEIDDFLREVDKLKRLVNAASTIDEIRGKKVREDFIGQIDRMRAKSRPIQQEDIAAGEA